MMKSQEIGEEDIWNKHLIEFYQLSRAHCLQTIVLNFQLVIQDLKFQKESPVDPNIIFLLEKLCHLFSLYWLDREMNELLIDGYFNKNQASWIKEKIKELLNILRPQAIGLVDAFGFSDSDLNGSALGRYDGRVYETLFEWAQKDPFNTDHQRSRESYQKYLFPIYHQTKSTSKL